MSEPLGILVEAKKEYLGQLSLVMCTPIVEVFAEMYDEANKLSKGRKVLIMFQKLLKEVPNWSNAMSKRHSDNITSRCAWFGDLLAAVHHIAKLCNCAHGGSVIEWPVLAKQFSHV